MPILTVLTGTALRVDTHAIYTGAITAIARHTVRAGVTLYTHTRHSVAHMALSTLRILTALRIFAPLVAALPTTACSAVTRAPAEQLLSRS